MKTLAFQDVDPKLAEFLDKNDPFAVSFPETLEKAIPGRYFRPVKTPISLRVDRDVLDWYKRNSEKYQTRMNDVLRAYMEDQIAQSGE